MQLEFCLFEYMAYINIYQDGKCFWTLCTFVIQRVYLPFMHKVFIAR